ncbi:MAG TPA: M20 family metallopeptidase [Vicinamibacteria bacterium]|nr:M20 family metallopeptidase [Vicinamibacteria bacterium]
MGRQEEGVVGALEEFLEESGLACRLVEVAPGRPNLYCTLDGQRSGRHLMLCGHTDTVPLNAAEPGVGFSGEIRDGHLLGRGSADMKGALAAMAGALVALHRAGTLETGAVTLAAIIDEEMESLGAEHLVKTGERADAAIVGEATCNEIAIGHRGLEWLEIELRGRSAHGGSPEAGVSAIRAAARFVNRAERELAPRFAARAHPLLGPPTLNVGTIQGGDQPSTVPAKCVLRLDRRSVPGESYQNMVQELQELLRAIESEMKGLTSEVRRMPGGMATLEHVALVTEPSHPIVRSAEEARRNVLGDAGLTTFPAWTDGALLSRFGGIPSIILGPGKLSLAHSPFERVPVADLLAAARIYALTAKSFCSP